MSYLCFFLFKSVIFLRDVTIGIKAKVLKIFLNILGLVGSELIDVVVCCVFVLNVGVSGFV